MPLASSPQRPYPLLLHLRPDKLQLGFAMIQREVLVESTQHLTEVSLLVSALPVVVFLEPLVNTVEEFPTAFNRRNPDQRELPIVVSSAHMFESEKIEGLRFLLVLSHLPSCKPAKEDKPRFLFRQFQSELPHSFF